MDHRYKNGCQFIELYRSMWWESVKNGITRLGVEIADDGE